jgi:hypothetical protein
VLIVSLMVMHAVSLPRCQSSKPNPDSSAAVDWINQNLCNARYSLGGPYDNCIPWIWALRSDNPARSGCESAILGIYAAENLCTSLLGLVIGHRPTVHKLTRGLFGKPGSNSARYTWIIGVCLHFAANALIANIIKRTPGYGSDFKIWQLTLFLTTRPRRNGHDDPSSILHGPDRRICRKARLLPTEYRSMVITKSSRPYDNVRRCLVLAHLRGASASCVVGYSFSCRISPVK